MLRLRLILLLVVSAWAALGCGVQDPQNAPPSSPESVPSTNREEKAVPAPKASAESFKPSDTEGPKESTDSPTGAATETETTGPSTASAGYAQLPDAEAALFFGSKEDPPPEVLNAQLESREGIHYLFSDEENPHKFYPKIKDVGGGFVGVGTDQCYLYIGWAKPKLAWLADYDPWVVALHRAYFVFFDAAKTPAEFVDFWDPKHEDETAAFLEKTLAGEPNASIVLKVYRKAAERVYGRLRRLIRLLDKEKIPGFVTDAEMYAFVRDLVLRKRVRAMLGNMLDVHALRGIAEVSRSLDVPIRMLYLSNAESYWNYPQSFRDNMSAMNFDGDSLVMRTVATKPKNGDYSYGTQSALDFVARVADTSVHNIYQIWTDRRVKGPDHIRFVHIEPLQENL